jgi:hypothetical protein
VADFSLIAHICGCEISVSAINDGTRWVLTGPAGQQVVARFQIAVRLAHSDVGQYLTRARRDQPWGLVVQAGTSSAIYGTPNPAAGVVLTRAAGDPNSVVARIRRCWREGDSPLSALENAVEIIRALTQSSRKAAA